MRFLIVDPQPLFRRALACALLDDGGLVAVGSTGDEEEAAVLASQTSADLVVSEVELDQGSGLHLATRLRDQVPVLILTRHGEGEVILDVAASGAIGCVGHAAGLGRLKTLLHRCMDGGFCVDEERLQQILVEAGKVTSREGRADIQSLTVREREILFRVASGASDEGIAKSLYISPHTVRTHIGNILQKLGVHSRAEAARVTLASGPDRPVHTEVLRIEGPGWMR